MQWSASRLRDAQGSALTVSVSLSVTVRGRLEAGRCRWGRDRRQRDSLRAKT